MFKNKLRTATATIVIALALVAAVASAADASPKHNHQQSSAEAKRQLCDDLKTIMEGNQDEAKVQWEAGNATAAAEADANATRAYNDARKQGCRWAARVIPPDSSQPPGQAPPPVGIFG